ncbi:5'-3' exonuclease [Microbacterium luticocti]|uniref:5'-3' exonuclease n=1 Tax=Microbacterium luticocti TaxID=451764 RepID=UPI00048E779A|nr:5'-3' exonuclease H3TH domain-containing protein [Microbacterium luticocti]
MTDRLMLLDAASLYFRAFYGVPDTVTAPDGTPVNAVRGLLDIVAKLVRTYRPQALVACWDDDWRPAWRVALLPGYKAHRVARVVPGGPDVEEVPERLAAQVPLIRETLAVLAVPVVGAAGYEADDVIGTLAARAGGPVDVVTGDRDLFQLVDDDRDVRVVYTARGMSNLKTVTDRDLVEMYGVHGRQYADFAALRGDPSDGLPGIAGIGEKSAAALLAAHGDLAGIRAAAAAGEGMTARVRSRLVDGADYLDVAPTVVAVARDVPVTAGAARLQVPDATARARAEEHARRWGLGGAMTRALDAVAEAAAAV